MPVDLMFFLATLSFAWGLSLATYRWFAVHNGWPMGEWQAHRPGLPIAIGLFAMGLAATFGLARGGATMLVVPLLGLLCALAWTAITRIGAQSSLLLAPLASLFLLFMWIAAVNRTEFTRDTQTGAIVAPASVTRPLDPAEDRTAAPGTGRGIATDRQPAPVPPPSR